MDQLVEYAGHEFSLNARQKDGCTLRQHLERVLYQTGKMPARLEPIDAPEAILYLWAWFTDLSNGRGFSEFGAMPLNYSEIQAWATLTLNDPTAWEVGVIKALDRAFLQEMMKK